MKGVEWCSEEMIALDLRTAVFSGVITDVVCTLLIVALWRQNHKRFDGVGYWAADFALQTAGLILIVVRGLIPDWLSMIPSNAMVIWGAICGYQGLERFLGRRGPQTHNYVLLAVFVGLHTYWTLISPSLWGRNLNLALALLLVTLQCVWLLFRRVAPVQRPLTFWVGVVFGTYTLIFAYRVVMTWLHPEPDSDYFHSGSAETVFHIIYQMQFICLTYALGLMVNKRLLQDIRTQEQKFSTAFRSAPYALTLTRASDGQIVEVNDGFTKLSGYTSAEAVGRTTEELHLWPQAEARMAVVQQLTARGLIEGLELPFRRKSGDLLTTLFSAGFVQIGGEPCILSSVQDITGRRRAEAERERLVSERERALSDVKILSGLLPICGHCKKIRDDKGYWNQLETYITDHSDAMFSHGLCPDCVHIFFPKAPPPPPQG